jgi:hypothetical protein
MRRWREPIGTVVSLLGFMAWVGLGIVISRVVFAALDQHPKAVLVLFCFAATIVAVGGLVIFWETASQVDFWRRGYRVRQLSPKNYFRWSLGPKQCVYEERAPDGRIRRLPFVRVVLANGYPAPCEVSLPGEDGWDAQMPSWARGRRTEIMEYMNECFGAALSRTHFVDAG